MKHDYIDKHCNIKSIIHSLDPRLKVICFFMFILFIVSTKPIAFVSLGLYGLIIVFLVLFSRIPVGFILKRSLSVIPFIIMVCLFVPFFKEGRIIKQFDLGILKLGITYNGLIICWNVLIKSYFSIILMIVLMSSMSFSVFLKALERLRFPKLFIMTLSFMYRYIFVITDELMKMMQAKESRSVGIKKIFHIKTLGNMVGVLFVRSYERAENVYLAMCSRGFDGQIRTIDNLKLGIKDICFFVIMIIVLTVIKFN